MENKEEQQKQIMNEVSAHLRKEHLNYKSRTQESWNKIHSDGFISDSPVKEIAKYAMRRIPHKGANIIDFGCGSGAIASHLRRFDMYVGVDISPKVVNTLMESPHSDKIYYLADSITTFKLPEQTDIGYCINTLECIEDDFLQKALLRISETVRQCVFSIDLTERPYHKNIQEPRWWLKEIEIYFDTFQIQNFNNHFILIGKSKV